MKRVEQDPNVTVPVSEETLTVTKRPVTTGKVRVSTIVRDHSETVSELLRHEEADIRRVAKNVPVSSMPPVRQDGDTVIVPIVEEVVVVEKRLVLKEEIHISKRTTTVRADTPVTLRKEDVVIERSAPEPEQAVSPSTSEHDSADSKEQ